MAKINGKGGKFMYGSVVVANITEWSISGLRFGKAKKDPAFADTVEEWVLDGVKQPGTISVRGNVDPADTNGQVALETAVALGLGFTNLYLYANTNTFWRVGTGGEILVESVGAVTLPRSGFGSWSLEAQASGAAMERVGTGT